jgi:hypothetical protein
MILDKKLQLASNLSIASGSRAFAGFAISPDKISVATLRDFGRGKTVYCCVTIKSTVTQQTEAYLRMSLIAEANTTFTMESLNALAVGSGGAFLANAQTATRLQPVLGTTGAIPCNLVSGNNFAAGKKYVFPISTMSLWDINIFGNFDMNLAAYFVLEEFNATTSALAPSSLITNGAIDVDIVEVADSGAGQGFCDLPFYPTSIKVQ